MKGINWKEYIRIGTITEDNDETFPDSKIVTFANIAKDFIAEEIQSEVDAGYFEITESRDLIEGQREYQLPADLLLNIKKTWIKVNGEWIVLKEFDLNQYDGVFENEEIKKEFSGRDPMFDITGRTMRIYSGFDIAATPSGLRIEGNIYPVDLTEEDLNSSDYDLSEPQDPNKSVKHGMPRSTHKLWADIVVKLYKTSKDKPIDLAELPQQLNYDMQQVMHRLRRRNSDSSFIHTIPHSDGSEY